jgi:hypothetical protein
VGHAVQWYLETMDAMSFLHGSSPSKVSTCPRQTKPGALLRVLPPRMRSPSANAAQTGAGTVLDLTATYLRRQFDGLNQL